MIEVNIFVLLLMLLIVGGYGFALGVLAGRMYEEQAMMGKKLSADNKRPLTGREREQREALDRYLRDRKRRPVDVSDMGVPHVSEKL